MKKHRNSSPVERARRKLSLKAVALLGQRPDHEVAAQFNLPFGQVVAERRKRGIPGCRPLTWTSERIALLGTMNDAAVARRLGISKAPVQAKRKALGIRPYRRGPDREWNEDEIALLGMESDRHMAKRLGLPVHRIQMKRRELGIAPAGLRGTVWTPEMVRRLGRDADFSRTLGRLAFRNAAGKPRRWTKDHLAMLGRRPDVELAIAWDIAPAEIRRKRVECGIPAFSPSKPSRVPTRVRAKPSTGSRHKRESKWTQETLALLGTMPDPELAHRLRVPTAQVTKRRVKARIPLFERRREWKWSKKSVALLGKIPDVLLAAQLGVTVHVVRRKRDELGIPELKMNWPPERLALLGTKCDSRLATEWNVPASWVARKRIEMGIPAWQGSSVS